MKNLVSIILSLMVFLSAFIVLGDKLLPSKETCQEYNLADSRDANEWVAEFQERNSGDFRKEISIAPGNQLERNRNSVTIGHSYLEMTCGLRFTDKGFFSQLAVE